MIERRVSLSVDLKRGNNLQQNVLFDLQGNE